MDRSRDFSSQERGYCNRRRAYSSSRSLVVTDLSCCPYPCEKMRCEDLTKYETRNAQELHCSINTLLSYDSGETKRLDLPPVRSLAFEFVLQNLVNQSE